MIPLHDDNPTTLRPYLTIGLIVACTLIYLWQFTLSAGGERAIVYALGLIPSVLLGDRALPPEVALIPAQASLLTSMFLHGGFMHLIGNMLYLWIFGNNVEDAMGHLRFAAFYILCGIAAALAQVVQDPGSTVPMIGASGAIGGVLGAYLLLHPKARILVLIWLGFFVTTARIPAYLVLGFWFVLQFVQTALAPPGSAGVAYWAHIGGFLAGLALIPLFKYRHVALLDRQRPALRRGSSQIPIVPRRKSGGPWT